MPPFQTLYTSSVVIFVLFCCSDWLSECYWLNISSLFLLILFSHHHHYQIDLSRMTISPMDGEFLDDLTNLAVYLKPAEGGNLRVVISRFLVDVINEAGLGISPLAGLLRESCHLPPGILSQGNTLMLLIAERLSMHLLKSKKLSEIPGLQYSKFSNTPLCKDQGDHFQVRYIPSFCVSTSCGKPAKRKINETEVISSFNPSDWNLFIDSPAVPRNAVGYPYDDNSAGPDGLALISSGNSQTPTLCMCMCIAAKKYIFCRTRVQ